MTRREFLRQCLGRDEARTRQQKLASYQRLRAERLALGACVRCGRPDTAPAKLCRTCRATRNIAATLRRGRSR